MSKGAPTSFTVDLCDACRFCGLGIVNDVTK